MVDEFTEIVQSAFELFIGHYQGLFGGARGVMVIVLGNGHGDTSSNPGRD